MLVGYVVIHVLLHVKLCPTNDSAIFFVKLFLEKVWGEEIRRLQPQKQPRFFWRNCKGHHQSTIVWDIVVVMLKPLNNQGTCLGQSLKISVAKTLHNHT